MSRDWANVRRTARAVVRLTASASAQADSEPMSEPSGKSPSRCSARLCALLNTAFVLMAGAVPRDAQHSKKEIDLASTLTFFIDNRQNSFAWGGISARLQPIG